MFAGNVGISREWMIDINFLWHLTYLVAAAAAAVELDHSNSVADHPLYPYSDQH